MTLLNETPFLPEHDYLQLRRVVYRFARNPKDRQDMTRLCIDLYQDRLKGKMIIESHRNGYLHRMFSNICRDYLRRKATKEILFSDLCGDYTPEFTEKRDCFREVELSTVLESFLQDLTEEEIEFLYLLSQEVTYEEMGKLFGISPLAAKLRVFRLRQKWIKYPCAQELLNFFL